MALLQIQAQLDVFNSFRISMHKHYEVRGFNSRRPSPSPGDFKPNQAAASAHKHGRPPDHSRTPSVTRSAPTSVGPSVTTGSLPRPPEKGIWADVEDDWEELGNASTDGSVMHTFDNFSSSDERSGEIDGELSGGSQQAARNIAAAEQQTLRTCFKI